MTRHKCSDKCPSAARNGPKIKCCKCNTVCHLQCFDFEMGSKVDSQDTEKITTNGFSFTTFLSTMAFSCCTEALSAAEQRAALKIPTVARSVSKSRSKSNECDQLLTNELNTIKEMLKSIEIATTANTAEIAEIKSMTAKTDASIQKVSEQSATSNQLQFNGTPKMSPALSYVNAFRSRATSKAFNSPNNKRKRTDSIERPKMKFPEPKVGVKVNVNGLSVVPKQNRNDDDKQKFLKALYVFGLAPTTTNEHVANYIAENTPVTDLSKFKVHKLVKKNTDETQLKFVSFKVEMNNEELDVLDNVDWWPEGIRVREFQVIPNNELGKHFPSLPRKTSESAANAVTDMET